MEESSKKRTLVCRRYLSGVVRQSLWFSLLNVLTSLDSELRVTQAVVNLLSSESHMLG